MERAKEKGDTVPIKYRNVKIFTISCAATTLSSHTAYSGLAWKCGMCSPSSGTVLATYASKLRTAMQIRGAMMELYGAQLRFASQLEVDSPTSFESRESCSAVLMFKVPVPN